jgi:N-acetylglucosamine kinase-like BadF-type ATPase
MHYILAIDSGGSKCDAVLIREDGSVQGWGRCDISHPESGRGRGGSGRSEQTVALAVRRAVGNRLRCEELHVTGRYSFPAEALPDAQRGQVAYHGTSEQGAALALVGEETGVVVLAGTGAFVCGRTRDGRELMLDALGPLLGDYGGAYHIGLLAVRAAARSHWHPRHQTSLAEVVRRACAEHAGNPPRFSLVEYMLGNRDRAEIASLAKLVDREANAGDRIAREILEEAAAAISETLYDVVDRLDIAREEYAMVGTGSVAVKSRIYWRHLCDRAEAFAPRLKPVVSDMPAVLGLALCAAREVEGIDLPAFRDTLFRTTRAMEGQISRE